MPQGRPFQYGAVAAVLQPAPDAAAVSRQNQIDAQRAQHATSDNQSAVLAIARRAGVESASELAFLAELESVSETYSSGSDLYEEGPRRRAYFMLEGWAARIRCLPDGRRQVVEFYLPGELLLPAKNPEIDELAPASALNEVTIADATRFLEVVQDGFARHDGLRAMHQELLRRRERHRLAHVTRLGAQTAYERTAHLLVEFDERLAFAGLSRNNTFFMPLSQVAMAHTLGLSVVHVNRVLQQMRRENLVELRSGRVCLLQPVRLQEVADFHRA